MAMNRVLFSLLIPILALTSCHRGDVYRNGTTAECNNFELYIARLFPDEVVKLYYNDELLLNYKVYSLDGFRFKRKFCLDYEETAQLRLTSIYQEKTYLDTVLTIKEQDFGYLLLVSVPHPVDWENYYDASKTIPIKEWGNLAIENSVRLIYLKPDTILMDSWTDISLYRQWAIA